MLKKGLMILIKILCLIFIVLLFALMFKSCRTFGYKVFSDRAKHSVHNTTIVEAVVNVKEDESLLDLAKDLETKNIIENKWVFATALRFMEDYDKIIPGQYLLKSSMKPSEILEILLNREEKQ